MRLFHAFVALTVAGSFSALHASKTAPAQFEQDFPFQMSCVGTTISTNFVPKLGRDKKPALTKDGKQIINAIVAPADNAMKGIAIKLGNDASVCFDTDLLRVSAGWTGGYMNFVGTTFNGAHGGWPYLAGEQKFRTPMLPGWADEKGSFADPRSEPFGPIPAKQGRWNGLYVVGEPIVLHYTIGGTKIWETPSSTVANDMTGFVRTFKTDTATRDLKMLVCELSGADGNMEGALATLLKGDCCISRAGLVSAPKGVTLAIKDRNRIVMKIAKGTPASLFSLVLWSGEQGYEDGFANLLKLQPALPDFAKGAPAHWPEPVVTKGLLNTSKTPDGAFVTDSITVPEQNPWGRRLRIGGMDFFSDGTRAAVSTWDGDILIVSGIDDKLEKLEWRRFASGLFEPLGLKIVNDQVYVSARDGIWRFTDLNGDGEADFYENFNNEITTSTGFHEFVFDLHTDAAGNFYTAKAGPVRGGGRGFGTLPEDEEAGRNFGTITKYAGTVMKISKDGSKLDVYARGLRAPNGIGVGPDGRVTTGDNEGTWVPACPLNWIEPGSGHNIVTPESHLKPNSHPNSAMILFPKDWDNSGGGQTWVTSEKWGPFKGSLLHTSYGQSSLYLVMPQYAGGMMQGAAVKIPVKFSSSAMRPRFNPKDGQLYVAGLRGWQSNAARETGFDRVRYTGKPVHTVSALKTDKAGIHLTFTQPLDETFVKDLQNYDVEAWNYLEKFATDQLVNGKVARSESPDGNYGGHEVSVKEPGKPGRDKLTMKAATLSADGRTVTLQFSDLQPAHSVLIRYLLQAKDGTPVEQDVLATIHAIP
jgi:hypothetical protein